MCLYPKRIQNKKFLINKKNGGFPPVPPVFGYDEFGFPIYDERVLYVNVPCGNCIECRKQKTRNWQVRLHEEIKIHKYSYFITLTFSPAQLGILKRESGLDECNAVAGKAVRRCLERYRKDHKKSLRHWFITELGHEGTERIHLHGMIFSDHQLEFVKSDKDHFYRWKYWKYGLVYVGDYCNAKTVNYIVKYMNKIDSDHLGFVGQIFCSPGIGRSFVTDQTMYDHRYRPNETKDFYRLNNGSKIKLPSYYKHKFLSDDERQFVWIEFMDSEVESVRGINYDMRFTSSATLGRIVGKAKEFNHELGYGSNDQEWRKKPYNVTQRMLDAPALKEARDQAKLVEIDRQIEEFYKKFEENRK